MRPSEKWLQLVVLVLRFPMGVALLIALSTGLAGCPPADSEKRSPALVDVHHDAAKQAAWSWLDGVEVDPVALVDRGVQGKKKLAEILEAYLHLLRDSPDASEQPRLLARIRELAAQASRPEYHNMPDCGLSEFNKNRMSYLRVAWLLDLLGQDTRFYRTQLIEMRPRLESELARRPPAQPSRIAVYYDHFGWAKPDALSAADASVLDRRPPLLRYQPLEGYALAQEVAAAFRHGTGRTRDAFDHDELAYLGRALPRLVIRFVAQGNVDLVAELIGAMTYLQLDTLPTYRAGVTFLLDSQNPNGSWGDYEQLRATYSDGVDQKFYLHTTMVTLRALLEVQHDAQLRTDAASRPERDLPPKPLPRARRST